MFLPSGRGRKTFWSQLCPCTFVFAQPSRKWKNVVLASKCFVFCRRPDPQKDGGSLSIGFILECTMARVQHEVVENAAKYGTTPEDARSQFKSPFSKNGTYPANLRVKTTDTRYWKDGALTTAPDSHMGKKWQACVLFKSLWFAPDAWGISTVATDMQKTCEVVECPF